MKSDIPRRSALAAGAALTAAIVVPAAARPAQAATRRRLEIGTNAGWFAAVRAEVPAVTCRRVYYPEHNFVPQQWPSGPFPSTAMVSIRPIPADLLAGRLDARIRAFLRSAPPGSDLTAWHEAGNLTDYPAYITPPAMRAVHAHMHRLCRGTHVRYGPILCMRPSSMPPWLIPGLDWYGLDIYDWPEFHSRHGPLDITGRLYPRLAQWRAMVQHVTRTRSPVLSICETNSGHASHRPKWFTALARWLGVNGGRRMLTYWNDTPGAVGPWLPHDTAVARALTDAATFLAARGWPLDCACASVSGHRRPGRGMRSARSRPTASRPAGPRPAHARDRAGTAPGPDCPVTRISAR
jgi:hypothetical protein